MSPLLSETAMSPIPADSRILVTATPDAPAPATTALMSLSRLPVSFAAPRSEHDNRRSVLVVVKHRDVKQVAQPRFDLEAARRADVLEVDAAERGREPRHGLDALIHFGAGQADRHRVHPGELFEQQRLALHDRHGGGWAYVAEAKHGRPVGHDRHRAAYPGEVMRELVVIGDGRAHPRDPGRIGKGQIGGVADRDGRAHLDLSRSVQREYWVHLVIVLHLNRLYSHGDPCRYSGDWH